MAIASPSAPVENDLPPLPSREAFCDGLLNGKNPAFLSKPDQYFFFMAVEELKSEGHSEADILEAIGVDKKTYGGCIYFTPTELATYESDPRNPRERGQANSGSSVTNNEDRRQARLSPAEKLAKLEEVDSYRYENGCTIPHACDMCDVKEASYWRWDRTRDKLRRQASRPKKQLKLNEGDSRRKPRLDADTLQVRAKLVALVEARLLEGLSIIEAIRHEGITLDDYYTWAQQVDTSSKKAKDAEGIWKQYVAGIDRDENYKLLTQHFTAIARTRAEYMAYGIRRRGYDVDVESICQECLLVVMPALHTYEPDSDNANFDAYFWRIINNVIIRELRKQHLLVCQKSGTQLRLDRLSSAETDADSRSAYDWLDVNTAEPIPGADSMADMIALAPEETRPVLELYFGQSLTVREVAKALGISIGSVSKLKRQALSKLRTVLEA